MPGDANAALTPPRMWPAKLVVAAVIVERGRILLTQRLPTASYPLTWECPGGKVEPTDASHEAALARELAEELCVTAEVIGPPIDTYEESAGGGKRVTFLPARIGVARPMLLAGVGLGWFTAEALRGLAAAQELTPGNAACLRAIMAHVNGAALAHALGEGRLASEGERR